VLGKRVCTRARHDDVVQHPDIDETQRLAQVSRQQLVRLHRAGELTFVWVPDDAQEALRDATRAREDLKHLRTQARQRLAAFLLRHDRRYPGKETWTQLYHRWLESLKFAHPTQQIVFQEYVDTVAVLRRRVAVLDVQIEEAAAASVFWPVIEALMALRGVKLLTATTVVAELGDLKRFAGAPQLMAHLGLVPSEYSSGPRKVRGAITKTGNGHVRRVLVEAAWTHRFQARKTAHLQQRARHAPPKLRRRSREVRRSAYVAGTAN